jgi:hypothetical protein
MKTTVVPAQITTVEDKIAGSLNFIQIMLLILSLIIGAAIYGVVPPRIHLTTLKLVLIAMEFSALGGMAIRIKGKIVAEWLIVILRFKLRPRIYVYTKNDLFARNIIVSEKIEKPAINMKKSYKNLKQDSNKTAEGEYFDDSNVSITVRPGRKGGLDVSLREI